MQPHAGDAQIAGVVGGAHRALASAIDDRPNSNNEASSPGAMQEGQVRPVVVRAPSQISTASQLLAGGIAGAFSKTCTAPLARLTILFQVQGMRSASGAVLSSPSILKEASRISREEGFRAFWKGNGVTIVHRLPYSSINFFAYEQYKMHLRRIMGIDGDQESLGVGMGTRLLAGGGAGITAASLTYPLDLVRTRLAAQTKDMYYKGITHALITITKDEGFWGLYKGMGTTLMVLFELSLAL